MTQTLINKKELPLLRYDSMCEAIAKYCLVDEVKEIHDKPLALKA